MNEDTIEHDELLHRDVERPKTIRFVFDRKNQVDLNLFQIFSDGIMNEKCHGFNTIKLFGIVKKFHFEKFFVNGQSW